MTILFIADLHLTPQRKDITDAFLNFMSHQAPSSKRLYVLGDLFEFWVGDNPNDPFIHEVKSAFKELTQKGVQCYFIQGNRDFLLDQTFCDQTGIILLPDEYIIDLDGQRALIMHGDTLCIDDVEYQNFRKKVHIPWLQTLFKRIPFFIRQKITDRVQHRSSQDKQAKNMSIMDVNQNEVERIMQFYQVDLLIHGHTHRPKRHSFQLNHKTVERIVLGDWYQQESVLYFNEGKFELKRQDFPSSSL